MDFAKIADIDEFLRMPTQKIHEILEDYVIWMKQNLHPNNVNTLYHPIQTLLEINLDEAINFKKLRRFLPKKVKTVIERSWNTEEIQIMLKVADSLKIIATVLFFASSGARLGVLNELHIKHLVPIPDEKYGKCYGVHGYANSKEEYWTFLTPEATGALDEYLATRQNLTSDSLVFEPNAKSIGV